MENDTDRSSPSGETDLVTTADITTTITPSSSSISGRDRVQRLDAEIATLKNEARSIHTRNLDLQVGVSNSR